MRRTSLTLFALLLVAAPVTGPVQVLPVGNGSTASTAPPVTDAATVTPQVASDLRGPAAALGGDGATSWVTVVLEIRPGTGAAVSRAVRAHGGAVVTRIEGRIEARVPHRSARELAERADVTFVRPPYRPHANATTPLTVTATARGQGQGQGQVVSGGLDDLRVPAVHRNGLTGENATVAVVGVGFDTSSPELAGHVARTKSFGSDGFSGGRTHGTAVAELVVDTAPNASLVLVEVDTMTQVARAVDWVDAQTRADVGVMSLGTAVGPLDGETTLGAELRQSGRHGTPWVVAAGNAGYRGHLNTTWRNADGDRWLEFAGDDAAARITASNGRVRVTVNWRDWPASSQNYDAYLQAWNGSAWVYVDQSENVQRGSQPPLEVLTASGYQRYRLRVWKRDAAGDASFDVFVNDGAALVEHYDRAQSVKRPAVVESVVAVGAVREGTTDLEPYSSRGPTVDGALKPEVVAPARVDTAAYDTRSFVGTSAAAPHVAGVAALLVDASNDRLSAPALRRTLRTAARDIRGTEPNNRTGYGLVDAESAVDALSTVWLDACARVDAGGRYRYETDAAAANRTCLAVTGDDVRVDGEGHTLAASGTAVRVTNATNVSVTDARLAGRVGLNTTASDVTLRSVDVAAREWALVVGPRSTVLAREVRLDGGTVGVVGTDVRLAGVAPPNETLARERAGPTLRVAESAGETRPNATVTLRVGYAESVRNESALAVWRYRNGTWTRVGGTVQSAANVVSVPLDPGPGVVALYGQSTNTSARTAQTALAPVEPQLRRAGGT